MEKQKFAIKLEVTYVTVDDGHLRGNYRTSPRNPPASAGGG